jgi:hypothetical protein
MSLADLEKRVRRRIARYIERWGFYRSKFIWFIPHRLYCGQLSLFKEWLNGRTDRTSEEASLLEILKGYGSIESLAPGPSLTNGWYLSYAELDHALGNLVKVIRPGVTVEELWGRFLESCPPAIWESGSCHHHWAGAENADFALETATIERAVDGLEGFMRAPHRIMRVRDLVQIPTLCGLGLTAFQVGLDWKGDARSSLDGIRSDLLSIRGRLYSVRKLFSVMEHVSVAAADESEPTRLLAFAETQAAKARQACLAG